MTPDYPERQVTEVLRKRLREIVADADAMDIPNEALLSWDAEENPNLSVGDLRELNAALAATTRSDDDAENAAWTWLESKWLNVEAGHDPNDRDYSADEMVDAFIAGIESSLKPDAELRKENERLKAENDRLSKVVCSGILGDLLSTDESDALVQFIRELRSAHESDGVQHG